MVALKKSAIKTIAVIGIIVAVVIVGAVVFFASFSNGDLSGRYVSDSGGYIEFTDGNKFMAGHPMLSPDSSNGTYTLQGNRILLTYTSEDFVGMGIHGIVSDDKQEIRMHDTIFIKVEKEFLPVY